MRIFRALILTFILALPAHANPTQSFPGWLDALKKEALSKGYSEAFLQNTFVGVEPDPKIVALDQNQPEGKLTLAEYQQRTLPPQRIRTAKARLQENNKLLKKIAAKYQVQPQYIIALWGMETDFGRFTGGSNIVEALTTLAYDGRRSAYFRKELFNALDILKQGHIPLSRFVGSWAGAMGQCQFMPSSFLKFAVDENKDGHKDIWQTRVDVFASIANYLHQSGWNNKEGWGQAVVLPTSDKARGAVLALVKQEKTVKEWAKLGLTSPTGKPLRGLATKAMLIKPEENKDAVFLVYNNYQVLLKWNRSNLYALSVSKLADSIVEKR